MTRHGQQGIRVPQSPPSLSELLEEAYKAGRLQAILEAGSADQSQNQRYLHWDDLRYRTPPAGLSVREWWTSLKLRRGNRKVPLVDCEKRPFWYAFTDPIPEFCHEIDTTIGSGAPVPVELQTEEMRNRYLMTSLMEEAATSSLLEGAATTRERARELLRSGRKPRDQAERMVVNNFLTMQQIRNVKDQPLSPELVLEIHRWITAETLENPEFAGRLRTPDQQIDVADFYNQILHTPPPANQLERRLETMCDFANGLAPNGEFLHPVLRSIILHFWLAYDHPFVDGNGRTARALFYWSMLRQGYQRCEFISISDLVLKGPVKYTRAFLYTETDDNDLTYFLIYHLNILRRAIKSLFDYLDRKTREIQELERDMRASRELNYRQRALISHALRHPGFVYTFDSHGRSHQVVHQTARTDLLDLEARGFLEKWKVGQRWQFTPVPDLDTKLRSPA